MKLSIRLFEWTIYSYMLLQDLQIQDIHIFLLRATIIKCISQLYVFCFILSHICDCVFDFHISSNFSSLEQLVFGFSITETRYQGTSFKSQCMLCFWNAFLSLYLRDRVQQSITGSSQTTKHTYCAILITSCRIDMQSAFEIRLMILSVWLTRSERCAFC